MDEGYSVGVGVQTGCGCIECVLVYKLNVEVYSIDWMWVYRMDVGV